MVLVLALGTGLYFRTYLLHQNTTPSPEKLARLFVENAIARQFEKSLAIQNPGLSGDDRLKVAREQAQRMIQNDRANFENAVGQTLKQLRATMPAAGPSRHFLLEADPYYYFYLTQQIIKYGNISDKIEKGLYFNPLMRAPSGYWTSLTWHPYLGEAIAKAIRFFKPQIDWMEALCWVPLVLVGFVGVAFWGLAMTLGAGILPLGAGLFALLLSPIFIQRSGFGWYDTDPYNYFFPFTILTAVFLALKQPHRVGPYAFVAGFLTGLYSLFWTGWPFIFVLVPAALSAVLILLYFFDPSTARELSAVKRYLGWHIFWSLLFVVLFLTPHGFKEAVAGGWDVLNKFSLSEKDVWPNIFMTVGEARGASLKKLIYLSGNYLTFGLAVWGLWGAGFAAWKEREARKKIVWLFFFVFSAPLFVLPLKTERFGILFVIPLAVWVMFGAREAQRLLEGGLKKISFFAKRQKTVIYTAGVIFFLLFLPLPLLTAHIVSLGVKPIMDEAWFQTMEDLKLKTPANSIVYSWWPPGYFVIALAERRVIADGGTQHFKETYWLARMLAAEDEDEALGWIRFLGAGGQAVMPILTEAGLSTQSAAQLVTEMVSHSPEEAWKQLPSGMPDFLKKKIIGLTHGAKNSAPAYLMVYQDLIEQNLAVTSMARWNFDKARAARETAKKNKNSNAALDFIGMTDGILKYTPVAEVQKKEGEIIYFANGLAVNLNGMDAVIQIPQKGMQSRPGSLFYMEGGQLQEKVFDGERVDVSALLIHDENGGYRAVLADPRLIRSLMFRLYYLHGEGLKHFRPFSSYRDPKTGNEVQVYEVFEKPKTIS